MSAPPLLLSPDRPAAARNDALCRGPKRRPAQAPTSAGIPERESRLFRSAPQRGSLARLPTRFSSPLSHSGTACFRCRVPHSYAGRSRYWGGTFAGVPGSPQPCGAFPTRCVFYAVRLLGGTIPARQVFYAGAVCPLCGDDMRREFLDDGPKIAFAGVRLQIDLRRHTLKPRSVDTGDEVGHDRSIHC